VELIIFYTDDFNIGRNSVTFPLVSSVGRTECFSFIPVDDDILEGTEVFMLQIVPNNTSDEAVAGGNLFTVFIQDNESKVEWMPIAMEYIIMCI
jgi:hypothetical protein